MSAPVGPVGPGSRRQSLRPPDRMNWQQDALWTAVGSRDLEEVRRLVRGGCDVNFLAPDGWNCPGAAGGGGRSLLHHAAWSGDLAVFRYLVDEGAEINAARQRNWARARGFTPFHHACFYGRADIVRFCLHRGADPNALGEDGYTPLHLAARHGYAAVAQVLVAAGAEGGRANKQGKTAADLARDDAVRDIVLRATPPGAGAPAHPPARRGGGGARAGAAAVAALAPASPVRIAVAASPARTSPPPPAAPWGHCSPAAARGGHSHDPSAATQNCGNTLGDRSCVRQSRLFREYESGNAVKALLGQGGLQWDVTRKQGAYEGQPVYHDQRRVERRGDRGRRPAPP